MIRATIEIVPFGVEDAASEIARIEIANLSPPGGSQICDYACRLYKWPLDRDVAWAYVRRHNRRDGAEKLVMKAIKELERWRG